MLASIDPEVLVWASFAVWSLLSAHRRAAGRWALVAAFAAFIAHASLRRRNAPIPALLALSSAIALFVATVRARRMPQVATQAPMLLAILMLCGAWNSITEASLRVAHPPRGEFIRIDAPQKMHVYCKEGPKGSPLVLLDAGLPCTSASWRLVMEQEAANAFTMCAFDRGGYGWSDKREGRRDAATLADEAASLLRVLLARRKQEKAIIVGWSFGGYTSIVLNARHRSLVSALVLVDSSTPYQTHDSNFANLLMTGRLSFSLMRLLLPLGACRAAEKLSVLPRDAGAPPPDMEAKARSEIGAHACWPGFAAAAAEELHAWRLSEQQVAASLPALAERPLVVLAANRGGEGSLANQRSLTKYGKKDSSIYWEANSDHDIPFHAPHAVIGAIVQAIGLLDPSLHNAAETA